MNYFICFKIWKDFGNLCYWYFLYPYSFTSNDFQRRRKKQGKFRYYYIFSLCYTLRNNIIVKYPVKTLPNYLHSNVKIFNNHNFFIYYPVPKFSNMSDFTSTDARRMVVFADSMIPFSVTWIRQLQSFSCPWAILYLLYFISEI